VNDDAAIAIWVPYRNSTSVAVTAGIDPNGRR
jgi:hypothetical protein